MNEPVRRHYRADNKRKRSGKFLYTLFLSFLLVGSIPLTLSAWRFMTTSEEWLGRNQRMIQLQSGEQIRAETDAFLELCSRDVFLISELLSSSRSQEDFRERISSAEFNAFLKKIVSGGRFSEIHVLSPSGAGVRAAVGTGIPDAALLSALEHTLTQSQLIVSPPLRGQDNNLRLTFSKRVERTTPLGVVIGVASLEPLIREVNTLGVDYEILIVDRQGRKILSSQREKEDRLPPELLSEVSTLQGQVVKNLTFRSGESGINTVATLISVRNLGWFIVVQADEDVTYYPVRQVLYSTGYWLIFALVLAGICGLIVSRHISQPVRQLVASSESLAAGNFGERVQIQAQNELGDLSEHFNSMAAKIEGYVEDLRAAVASNRQLFLEAVQTVAAAIDEKDPYTKGHSERVTHYAVVVAEELGLSSEEVESTRVAALLHDVGKIGIPDEILRKPLSLDSKEFELMKQHPVKGARIVGQISQLQDVIPGILYHHEKVDGTGYPEGLSGSQIPMQARIIAVVDAFDALTTQRAYQGAISPEGAVERVESFVGSRYDATVVAALKSALTKNRIKLRKPSPRDLAAGRGLA